MTEETKNILLATLCVIFYPISGIIRFWKENKNERSFENLATAWAEYFWQCCWWAMSVAFITFITCGFVNGQLQIIISFSIIAGILFIMFIPPYLLHKFTNRK